MFYGLFCVRTGFFIVVLGFWYWVLVRSEEACDFRFTPALKGAGNLDLDVVSAI